MTKRATAPVDAASLAVFRMVFGAIMVFATVRFLASGWIPRFYGEPSFWFSYPGFAWATPWPVWGVYVHYAVLAGLAALIMVGCFTRLAAALFAVAFAYAQLFDVTNYLNHHYLVVLLAGLIAVLPTHVMWSVDARRNPALRSQTVPAYAVWLLRFQLGVVYVFAGLAKAKLDWLEFGQPLGIWLTARTETPVIGTLFDERWFALGMSWGGFLFDTTIVLWLSWRRTRLVAYAALIAFHGLTGYLFNIGMFPLIMTTSALVFFSPSWPRWWLGRFGRGSQAQAMVVDAAVPAYRRPGRHALAAIGLYVVMQLVLPLRHLWYQGDVLWNEDGMRFAWHVMVREKQGSVRFLVRFADGRELEVPPRRYLAWRQEREMSGQPDLILQMARHIGAQYRAEGHDVAVHAEALVSLNGRAPTPMIDPDVNLLAVKDIGSRTWVLPAPMTPPHRGVN